MNVVATIVIIIILAQIYFFIRNLKRMKEFKNIFNDESSWQLTRNEETNIVSGIYGEGNDIFEAIRDSINKYLNNNAGSVIDFGLLKDAIDRHCDSVENDISTQTPIPLYCGLAGTMAGVIIGLWDLLSTGSISALMGSTVGGIDAASSGAAAGINSLLNGVAWAMLASICGILLTTINSLLFKNYKLKEESGKNSFLAWMQSELLPELPSDTSQALNNLVKNLNKFNSTFKNNTKNLGTTLQQVNESYEIQANIIQNIHDMDVLKMAKANSRVLKDLQDCTDKLEQFYVYLNSINGYTDAIHRFEEQFQRESDRIHVLEEIKKFFEEHKGSMNNIITDVDETLKKSFNALSNSSSESISELSSSLVKQNDHFQEMITEQQGAFEDLIKKMNTEFTDKLSRMPKLEKRLDQIADIPEKLDKLIENIEKSNIALSSNIKQTMSNTAQAIASGSGDIDIEGTPSRMLPKWMQWFIIACIGLITLITGWKFISDTFNNKDEESIGTEETVIIDKSDTDIESNITEPQDSLKTDEDKNITPTKINSQEQPKNKPQNNGK